jgi:hypothetical protein
MNEHSPAPHPAALPLAALLAQCEVRRQRRSGPGGQHRNKVETAVVLVHRPSGIRAEASERRSQDLNHQMAVQRLRVKLAISVRSEQLPAESLPSELWRSRLRGGKLSVSSEHADFPALLAEALDVLAACDFDMPAAAAYLGASSTQLLKLLKQEPEAFVLLNAERTNRNLRPLR